MTKTETIKIMAILNAAYPSFYKNLGKADYEAIVQLWNMQFADYDYSVVSMAVNALISTRVEGYPPTIGAVKEQIVSVTTPTEMTAQEAWGLVMKAVRDSSYHARENHAKLPPIVQEIVKPEELREWGISTSFNESVVSSHFIKAYNQKLEQKKKMDMLPSSIRQAIAQTTERLMLK